MQPLNLKGVSLKKRLFTWKQANPRIKSQNTVYQSLMANKKIKETLNQKGEQKAFFNAIREEGTKAKGKGINKKTFIEIIKKTAESGLINKQELRALEKEMVGGDLASRFGSSSAILEKKKLEVELSKQKNPHQESKSFDGTRKIYEQAVERSANVKDAFRKSAEIFQPTRQDSKTVDLSVSNKNYRNWEQQQVSEESEQKSASVADYVSLHQTQKSVDEKKVMSLLEKIQSENDQADDDSHDLKMAA